MILKGHIEGKCVFCNKSSWIYFPQMQIAITLYGLAATKMAQIAGFGVIRGMLSANACGHLASRMVAGKRTTRTLSAIIGAFVITMVQTPTIFCVKHRVEPRNHHRPVPIFCDSDAEYKNNLVEHPKLYVKIVN